MINIFSIFDPSTSIYTSLNWSRILLFFFFLPIQYWIYPSRYSYIWIILTKFIFNEFKILIPYSFSNIIFFIRLFILILFNNFLGLFPYIFTASRHINFCLSLSLTFWLSILIYTLFNFLNNFFAHLTPLGTPPILMPFIVIIERIRFLIRPFTLAIRLTANIIAGHLLLSLIGSSNQRISNFSILIILILSQIILFTLEISVSIIQAYVFSILSTLYRRET